MTQTLMVRVHQFDATGHLTPVSPWFDLLAEKQHPKGVLVGKRLTQQQALMARRHAKAVARSRRNTK